METTSIRISKNDLQKVKRASKKDKRSRCSFIALAAVERADKILTGAQAQ